ncbi:MAG: ABC transporter permease [Chloroflexota bacterium]|nr:ABC transporter permease [Chloroflexota bacterium]MDE2941894.1 ABC transporter permease [Chloroflexota bacterium]MDE3268365.1 ABC transporter permease [Chloroflexota bacterium]
MHKTWLVARHEFSVTLGRLSYRIFAASVPVLAIVALIGFAVFEAVRSDNTAAEGASYATGEAESTYGYVDLTGGQDGPLFTDHQLQDDTRFVPYPDQERATQELLDGRIDRLFVFPAEYLQTGAVVEVRKERAGVVDIDGGGRTGALRGFVLENLFEGRVDPEEFERIRIPYRLVTVEVSETGTPAESDIDTGNALTFIVAGVLLLVSGFTASGYLLQGLTEEKENRIMEVLLSSIKPEHLMFGKLAGLGAASLLQIALWAVTAVAFLLVLNLIVELPFELNSEFIPSPGSLLTAFAYFLLGYALIGTLLAAIGAVTTNQRQAGNISAFVIVPAIAPMWFMITFLENPEGTVARVLSFIPFTAPVASLTRLSLGGMGGVEVILSLLSLAISVVIVVGLTARLFRAYLLAYGQQPSLGNLVRTLRGR